MKWAQHVMVNVIIIIIIVNIIIITLLSPRPV